MFQSTFALVSTFSRPLPGMGRAAMLGVAEFAYSHWGS